MIAHQVRQPRGDVRASSSSWCSDRAAGLLIEMAGVTSIVLVAGLLRLPYLWDAPRLTDESKEALRALQIVQGGLRPLTNADPYIGALWNYLLAAVFWLAGPSLQAPRALAAGLGTLAVVPTYLLGRVLGGSAVGALAAGFLALSPMHIAVNSHIGWSNCITPLFTTGALWLTYRAVAGERPASLVWAGGMWGLALLTHPTAALFLPAVALYVVAARPGWLRTRWPWLACGLGLIACSTLLVANVQSGFAGLRTGLEVQSVYSGGEALTPTVYGRRLIATVYLLSDSLGGGLTETSGLQGPLGLPLGLAYCATVALGLALTARRHIWLPALAFGIYVLLLPVVNARYAAAVPKARYVAPLLPLCYAVVSLYLAHPYRTVSALPPAWQSSGGASAALIALRRGGRFTATWGIPSLMALVLLLAPLASLNGYYRQTLEQSRTNAQFYRTVSAVHGALRPGDQVNVDRALVHVYTSSSGTMFDHLQFAGGVYRWGLRTVNVPKTPDDAVPTVSGLLVIARSSEPMARATWQLQEIDGTLAEDAPVRAFRVLGTRTVGTVMAPANQLRG